MYFKGILTFLDLKPTRLARNDKNFLSFLILIIYHFFSKFLADYEFAIKK